MKPPKCFPCHGSGYVTVWAGLYDDAETHYAICKRCGGTGEATPENDDEQGENAA